MDGWLHGISEGGTGSGVPDICGSFTGVRGTSYLEEQLGEWYLVSVDGLLGQGYLV